MESTTAVLYNLYCRLRDAGQPLRLVNRGTAGTNSPYIRRLTPSLGARTTNRTNLSQYKSPCRRRHDLKRSEQRRAQRAGDQVQGAGGQVQGAGDLVHGVGYQVQGAGAQVNGAGGQVQGAGDQVQGAGDHVQGAGDQVQGIFP